MPLPAPKLIFWVRANPQFVQVRPSLERSHTHRDSAREPELPGYGVWMAEDRPKIPNLLRREVLEEAGYACAIPVCRIATVEIAHIEPWSKVKEHTFDNLIALCPNHHTLYDVEKKIPKASVLRYKANLAVLNGRYSDLGASP